MRTLPFEQATRDAIIDRLPAKERVRTLLKAVDALAQAAIAAGDPDAFADDGQVLVARLSNESLRAAAGVGKDTILRAIADARATRFLDVTPETGRASIFCVRWPAIMGAAQPVAGVAAPCGGSQVDLRGVAPQGAGGRTQKPPIKPGGTHPPPHPSDKERVSEGDFVSGKETRTHSLTHSAGDDLPPLPLEVWDPGCNEQRLYAVMGDWWRSEGLADRGFDSDAVLGAVLASRRNCTTDHQRYVERCLKCGVRSGWRKQAIALRRRCRPQDIVVPAVPPAERKKPARVIGLQD